MSTEPEAPKVFCPCDVSIDDAPGLLAVQRIPCTECGSTVRSYSLTFRAEIMPTANIKGRKYPDRRRGRHWLIEFFDGLELSSRLGELVRKSRRIDRENNRYQEHVETKDGQVLHHCEEPLSEHVRHGSA